MYVHIGEIFLSAAACKCFAARIQIVSKCTELKGNEIGKDLTFPESIVACKCFAESIQIVSQVRGVKSNAIGKGLTFP